MCLSHQHTTRLKMLWTRTWSSCRCWSDLFRSPVFFLKTAGKVKDWKGEGILCVSLGQGLSYFLSSPTASYKSERIHPHPLTFPLDNQSRHTDTYRETVSSPLIRPWLLCTTGHSYLFNGWHIPLLLIVIDILLFLEVCDCNFVKVNHALFQINPIKYTRMYAWRHNY